MKELLTALINSNNESGKHIHYLYRKYCKLLYGVDYGYKIYDSEELFTDFMKYILDVKITVSHYNEVISIRFQEENNLSYFDENIHIKQSANATMTSLRRVISVLKLKQNKQSNLNTLKNAKLP